MSTLADIRTRVIAQVKDDSGKLDNPGDYDNCIEAALKIYSKHNPDLTVVDVTGDGTGEYDLPTGWIDEFSSIEQIEIPIGDIPPSLVDDDEYGTYLAPGGEKLRLFNLTPEVTESFRVTFTVLRTDATVPDGDLETFVLLAASLCCEVLSNAFIQSSSSLLGADSVDYKSKTYAAASRAKSMMKLYLKHMGLKESDTTPPASATTDLSYGYPGGGSRLTHPRGPRRRR